MLTDQRYCINSIADAGTGGRLSVTAVGDQFLHPDDWAGVERYLLADVQPRLGWRRQVAHQVDDAAQLRRLERQDPLVVAEAPTAGTACSSARTSSAAACRHAVVGEHPAARPSAAGTTSSAAHERTDADAVSFRGLAGQERRHVALVELGRAGAAATLLLETGRRRAAGRWCGRKVAVRVLAAHSTRSALRPDHEVRVGAHGPPRLYRPRTTTPAVLLLVEEVRRSRRSPRRGHSSS